MNLASDVSVILLAPCHTLDRLQISSRTEVVIRGRGGSRKVTHVCSAVMCLHAEQQGLFSLFQLPVSLFLRPMYGVLPIAGAYIESTQHSQGLHNASHCRTCRPYTAFLVKPCTKTSTIWPFGTCVLFDRNHRSPVCPEDYMAAIEVRRRICDTMDKMLEHRCLIKLTKVSTT